MYIIVDEDRARAFFASRLRSLLESRKLSQVEVCRRMDVPTATMSAWVTGKRFPSSKSFEKLANILDVQVTDLVPADTLREVQAYEDAKPRTKNKYEEQIIQALDQMNDEDARNVLTYMEIILKMRDSSIGADK